MSKRTSTPIISSDSNLNHEQGYLQLPYDKETFREFISGLLGKPQTINTPLKGNFDIKIEHIDHLYQLINQRIIQQNDANLIQFNARIVFSDNSSVILNSFAELITYNEIKAIVSDEIHMTFMYLIKFRDKNIPEKQEINISILASSVTTKINKKYNSVSNPARIIMRVLSDEIGIKPGIIQYEIKHTARTWAADIDSLLSNYFKSIFIPDNKLNIFFKEYGLLTKIFFFFTLLVIIGYNTRKAKDFETLKLINDTNIIFNNKSIDPVHLNNKLKFIAESIQKRSSSPDDAFFLVIFGMVFIYMLAGLVDVDGKSSFILLTREAQKQKEIADKKYNNKMIFFIGTIIFNIALNLAASIIYDTFFKV